MNAWPVVSQLGNSLLMLPTALAIGVGLSLVDEDALALRWLGSVCGAALVALATKVAFLGWGIGSRALDFTGISGHALLAAAVLPTMAWWWVWERRPAVRIASVAAAAALAAVVGASRLVLDAHSVSEVLSGLLLGGVVTGFVVAGAGPPPAGLSHRWIPGAALLAALAWAGEANPEGAHGLVVRLALFLSGRAEPFTRQTW